MDIQPQKMKIVYDSFFQFMYGFKKTLSLNFYQIFSECEF